MIDILLPETDAAVYVQFAVVTIAAGIALLGLWRWREFRVFVIGLAILAYGVMAVRAIH